MSDAGHAARGMRAYEAMEAAQASVAMEAWDTALRHLGRALIEFEADHTFADANRNVLEAIAQGVRELELCRAQLGQAPLPAAQRLLERVGAVQATLRGQAH